MIYDIVKLTQSLIISMNKILYHHQSDFID